MEKLQQLNGRIKMPYIKPRRADVESTGAKVKLLSCRKINVKVFNKSQGRGRAASHSWASKSVYWP